LYRYATWLAILALSAGPALCEDVWKGVQRVVAVGDVHGDYGQFLRLLRVSGVVDDQGRWSGGATHLVQMGDVPDRGPDTRRIIDLLMELERQARRAGGFVHALVGNHEAMNIYGDLRYVIPEEFAAFRDSGSERLRDQFWEQHIEEIKNRNTDAGEEAPPIDAAYKQKWYDEHPLGWFEHRVAWRPNGRYGKWVRSHNAVIRIDDTLFVHGGISPRLAGGSLREINETVRKELEDFSLLQDGIVIASDGPLWYRGLAQGDETELGPHVDAALTRFGVKRIVVGHTPTPGAVIPRFGGKVLLNDVGLSKAYGSRLACLVIEDGRPAALHRGERLALPDGSREDQLRYLKAAAALDPQPSPLNALIGRLEAGEPGA
jgi:hypothetical protein